MYYYDGEGKGKKIAWCATKADNSRGRVMASRRATPNAAPRGLLAAIGIFSAAPYRIRRDTVRATWLPCGSTIDEEVSNSLVLGRFVIATAPDERNSRSGSVRNDCASSTGACYADENALLQEAAVHGDVVLLPTNVTSRDWGPYVLLYAWLRFATTTAPFRDAAFVAKIDDDGYVLVPELVAHLQAIRSRNLSHVYYGNFMWTSWHVSDHHHVASSMYAQSAKHDKLRLMHGVCANQSCVGPFVYGTAPFQCVGQDLAQVLATSDVAAVSVNRSLVAMRAGPKRGPPAMEDVCPPPLG